MATVHCEDQCSGALMWGCAVDVAAHGAAVAITSRGSA